MRAERRFVMAALSALLAVPSLLFGSAEWALARSDSHNDPSRWRELALTRALAAADQIQDPYRRAEILAEIASAQVSVESATAGDKAIHRALAAAALVDTLEFRGWVLNDIVLAQIAAEDLVGAQKTADSISAARPQSSALAAIARFHIRADAVPAAQALASRIPEEDARSEVLRQIVAAHCGRGDIKAALPLLAGIEDKYYSAVAHGDVAVALVHEGQTELAHAVATRARRASRDEVYARIALARSELDDLAGARQSLQKIGDPVGRATAQGRVAFQHADNNDLTTARAMLASAMSDLQQAKAKPEEKLFPTAQLARWQAAVGDEGAALETLRRLRVEVEQQPASPTRNELLEYIGRGQARAGDVRGAIDAAKKIDDRVARALLVRDVVSMHAEATSASAAVWAREFNDPLIDTAAQFGVLSLQSFRVGQPLSLDTIDAARVAVQRVAEVDVKPAALAALAAARVKAGDLPGSEAIFKEALASAGALPRAELQASAHVRIVNALNDRLMFLGRAAGEHAHDNK